jgi:hypothetical protein
MARHRNDLGARKQVRVELYKPGFLIPAPEAPWIECLTLDVSDSGVCLEVGALAVPKLFGLTYGMVWPEGSSWREPVGDLRIISRCRDLTQNASPRPQLPPNWGPFLAA